MCNYIIKYYYANSQGYGAMAEVSTLVSAVESAVASSSSSSYSQSVGIRVT